MFKSHMEVVAQFMEDKGRGEHARDLEAAKLDQAREKCARLFSVNADEITFLSNATEGINNVVFGLDWKPGDNIVVVATGDVNHDELVEQVNQHFAALPKSTTARLTGTDKPIYAPSILFMRDDEMVNANVGVFYDAPSAKHEDFYSFLLLKHMFGEYRIDQHAEHLNDTHKQYNSMHSLLGALPDVTRANAHYLAYSDCGLFGNYFYGNEIFTRQMNYCGVCLPTIYSHYLNDVEVVRGRNNVYNAMLTGGTNTADLGNHIGQQILKLGRRVPRSEIATRIANIDNYHIKHLCNEWFYDAEPSFTSWGPIEAVSHVMSYKYFKINTMSTVINSHHTLFT